MEEDIQNYSRTVMFRGTPCISHHSIGVHRLAVIYILKRDFNEGFIFLSHQFRSEKTHGNLSKLLRIVNKTMQCLKTTLLSFLTFFLK